MSSLTYVEKEKAATFFGFSHGYIFTFLDKHDIPFNKYNTQRMIRDACGIDIFADEEFNLSQERCIRKIWDEKDDVTAGKLLKVMLDYYRAVANWDWDWREKDDYQFLRGVEKRLLSSKSINLPTIGGYDLSLLKEDIRQHFANNTPELVLDHLHTFASHFFREISIKHGIKIANDNGENYSLDTVVANLKNYYRDENYFDSEFCVVAIQNTINIFAKFNQIRNTRSFSHPNTVLSKVEAEYVVRIVSDTIQFVDQIEKLHPQSDDLPF